MDVFKDKKYLIVHADDAGLSYAHNKATIAVLEHGVVTSYSIMVPCPWFYEMAQFARANPKYDTGIHLTLTCEWKNYKFGPVLPISEVPSLVDAQGYFYPKRALLEQYAKPSHVAAELEAQIKKALDFGIQPTHIDSHMYSVGSSPEFLEIYKELGKKYRLPVLLNKEVFKMTGLSFEQHVNPTDLTVEYLFMGNYSDFEKGTLATYYLDSLKDLQPGLNMMIIHPAYNTPEMQGITIDHPNFGAEWRQIDVDTFTSEQCKEIIDQQHIELITWKEVAERYQQHIA